MKNKNITLSPDIYFENVPKTLNMNIRSELYAINEFTFAVAVILSAQATDKKVNEVTPNLFKIAPTPDKMLELGLDELKKQIRVISFFNNKANNIIKLAAQLKDKNSNDLNYKFPQKYHNRAELMKLAGVGQKTANVIMNVLWNMPNIGVDTHVFRVSNRLGLCKADTVEETEKQMTKLIPREKWGNAHHWLIWHGRRLCKAQRPLCGECPLNGLCPYKGK